MNKIIFFCLAILLLMLTSCAAYDMKPAITVHPVSDTDLTDPQIEHSFLQTERPGSQTEKPGSQTEKPDSETGASFSETESPASGTDSPASGTESPTSETEPTVPSTEPLAAETKPADKETEPPAAETKPADKETEPPNVDPPGTPGGTEVRPGNTSVASPSANGALHVDGTKLVDKNGKPVILRGISTHGLAWFPDYVNLDCFRQLRREWNVNVIRLAMYTAEYGGYCSGGDRGALKDLIDRGVRYAAEADMYVIIDWHILSDNNPNMHRDEAIAFFREMSARYANMDHVIYEICNEPNGNVTWKDIKNYAVKVIGAIRKNDPDAVILVGTPNWSQHVDIAAADPIREYDNLMYTLHFYAATHKDDLRGRMKSAVNSGLPVFVSEYGICDASGNGAIDKEQAKTWLDLLDKYGVSYVAWNLSNKNETSAILRPGCSKVSGFTADDLSDGGKWLYRRLTGTAPAEPSRDESDTTDAPQNPAGTQQPPEELKTDSFDITLTMVNTWNSGGQTYCQYSLTMKNISGKDADGWKVTLPFQKKFTLTGSWNGVFSINGKNLVVSPVDYNSKIPAGETVKDIGFIICYS